MRRPTLKQICAFSMQSPLPLRVQVRSIHWRRDTEPVWCVYDPLYKILRACGGISWTWDLSRVKVVPNRKNDRELVAMIKAAAVRAALSPAAEEPKA